MCPHTLPYPPKPWKYPPKMRFFASTTSRWRDGFLFLVQNRTTLPARPKLYLCIRPSYSQNSIFDLPSPINSHFSNKLFSGPSFLHVSDHCLQHIKKSFFCLHFDGKILLTYRYRVVIICRLLLDYVPRFRIVHRGQLSVCCFSVFFFSVYLLHCRLHSLQSRFHTFIAPCRNH